MTADDAAPVARVWQLSGGDLHDPVVAEAYCDEIVPRLLDMPGYLGVLVVVDHDRDVLRGVSFWAGEEAQRRSHEFGNRAAEAVSSLASAHMDGSRAYDVAVCRFRDDLDHASERGEVHHLLVRLGALEGPAFLDPARFDRLVEHVSTVIAPAPGCVGALLLRDRVNPGVFGLSFWADPVAARRTEALGADLMRSLREAAGSESSTSSGQGSYRVLVNRPMARQVG